MNGTVDAGLAGSLPDVPQGPGASLAQLREARRMSIDDVANRLKFAPRQIEALEADDYSRLPGMTFVRGMVRSYAKLLDADAAPLLASLVQSHAPSAPADVDLPSKPIPFPDGRSRSTRVYLVLSILVLVGAAGVLYEWHFGMPDSLAPSAPAEPARVPVATPPVSRNLPQEPTEPAAPTQPEASASAPVSPAQPQAQASGAPTLELLFNAESWVEVKERSGKILLSQLNPAGSRKTVEGTPPFEVIIGNASHVSVLYRDKPFDLKPHTKVDVARFTLN